MIDVRGDFRAPRPGVKARSVQGELHAAALLFDGTVTSWDMEEWRTSQTPTAKVVAVPGFVGIRALGGYYAHLLYAVRDDGRVAYWSDSYDGPHTALTVSSLGIVKALSIGNSYLDYPHCVIRVDGAIACWAKEERGRLGTGDWPSTKFEIDAVPEVLEVSG